MKSKALGSETDPSAAIEHLRIEIERVRGLCRGSANITALRHVINEAQQSLSIKLTWNRDRTRPLDDYEKAFCLPSIEQWKLDDWRQVAIALAKRLQEADARRKPGRRARRGKQTARQIAALSFWADEMIAEKKQLLRKAIRQVWEDAAKREGLRLSRLTPTMLNTLTRRVRAFRSQKRTKPR
jgi:hypothetical protein